MFIGFSMIYCFSSYVNSRVPGINVVVSMQMVSTFSDLDLFVIYLCEPTTLLKQTWPKID